MGTKGMVVKALNPAGEVVMAMVNVDWKSSSREEQDAVTDKWEKLALAIEPETLKLKACQYVDLITLSPYYLSTLLP